MNTDPQKRPFIHAVRKIVPDSVLRERQVFLCLGRKARPIYAWLRLLDFIGVHSPNMERIRTDARSFLFVCFGNIMRSPMAEAMFRKSAAEANLCHLGIRSAGLHAVPGSEAHPRALAASQEVGLSLAQHRAQLLTAELVSQADVIFAMDFRNKAEMLALYPDAGDKILMLSAYGDGPTRYREIPDPYFGDLEATRHCYAVLQTCIRNLTNDLATRTTTSVAS